MSFPLRQQCCGASFCGSTISGRNLPANIRFGCRLRSSSIEQKLLRLRRQVQADRAASLRLLSSAAKNSSLFGTNDSGYPVQGKPDAISTSGGGAVATTVADFFASSAFFLISARFICLSSTDQINSSAATESTIAASIIAASLP